MQASTIFLVMVIVVIISVNYYVKNRDVVTIKSNIDGRMYRIADTPDKQQVADLLAKVNQGALKLVEHLKGDDNPLCKRVCKYYNPDRLGENLEYKSYKAYSLNKGEEIVLCVRNKDDSVITDMNTMMFVLIHELGHLMTEEDGHPPAFWKNMEYLLKKGDEAGVYKPVNYFKEPVDYCGTLIDKTPYQF
jgi:hypothetical protein